MYIGINAQNLETLLPRTRPSTSSLKELLSELTIQGAEIIYVVLSEYKVEVDVMLKGEEGEEGDVASMLLDQQQEHFWEVRGHGHTLDQSLIFCIYQPAASLNIIRLLDL